MQTVTAPTLSPSDLYAQAIGIRNGGDDRCHWCGSACQRILPHDDDPPIPFVKGSQNRRYAKCPGHAYVCMGCWRFRALRVTVNFLGGSLIDSRCPMDFSWLITETGVAALNPRQKTALYPVLLKPPLRFWLGLVEGMQSHLQLQVLNDLPTVQSDSPITFTFNGLPLTYTIYELEEGLRHGVSGKSPGVQTLIRFLGEYKLPMPNGKDVDEQRGKGRPRLEEINKPGRKVVAASGR